MHECRIDVPTVLDPRPPFSSAPLPLAPRLASLEGRRLLLFDNGQLRQYEGRNRVALATLAQRLQEQYGVAVCERMQSRLANPPQGYMRRLAENMAHMGVEGVVIALCDPAVATATVVLAWELERHGLPTATLCAGQAIHLAAALTMHVLPGLPLSPLHVSPHMAPSDITAESIWVAGEVEEALTASVEMLETQFWAAFAPGGVAPIRANGAGELSVGGTYEAGSTSASEPPADAVAYTVSIYDAFCRHQLCDGLPIIPPTPALVEAMLAATDREPRECMLSRCFPSGLPLTVGKLAVNAVMAGCQPAYFPILLAAAEAVAAPEYRLSQALASTHPAGNAIIVSGPLAAAIGLSSGGGCLGPGYRANLTLGRALNLSLLNTSGALPGRANQATMGSPSQVVFCCAEDLTASAWPPLHIEHFGPEVTAVTVLRCEGPYDVRAHQPKRGEDIMRAIATVAAALVSANAELDGGLLVLLGPDHAKLLQAEGWAKADVQQELVNNIRRLHHQLTGRDTVRQETPPQAQQGQSGQVPQVPTPYPISLVITGAAGPHSMIAPLWGRTRAVTKAVAYRDGRPIRSLRNMAMPH